MAVTPIFMIIMEDLPAKILLSQSPLINQERCTKVLKEHQYHQN